MTADRIRQDLRDVLAWLPLVDEIAAHACDAGRGNGGGPASARASTVERAAAYRATIAAHHDRLAALAAEVQQTRGDTPVKPSAAVIYLAGLADWIAASPLAADAAAEIAAIRGALAALAGYTPERSGFACASCRIRGNSAPRLERRPTPTGYRDVYECPVCGFTAHIEPAGPWNQGHRLNTLEPSWRETLRNSKARLKPTEVARLLDMKDTNRIRQWIHRGRLTKDDDGTVAISDIAALAWPDN